MKLAVPPQSSTRSEVSPSPYVAAETVVEGSKDWQMGNAGAEEAEAAAGRAAEDGPRTAVEAATGAAAGVRSPATSHQGQAMTGQGKQSREEHFPKKSGDT